jgi:hypothetical protein
MPTNDRDELLTVVETIRKELHPDLDAEFLSDVVAAEELNMGDEDAAIQAIRRALRKLTEAKGLT